MPPFSPLLSPPARPDPRPRSSRPPPTPRPQQPGASFSPSARHAAPLRAAARDPRPPPSPPPPVPSTSSPTSLCPPPRHPPTCVPRPTPHCPFHLPHDAAPLPACPRPPTPPGRLPPRAFAYLRDLAPRSHPRPPTPAAGPSVPSRHRARTAGDPAVASRPRSLVRAALCPHAAVGRAPRPTKAARGPPPAGPHVPSGAAPTPSRPEQRPPGSARPGGHRAAAAASIAGIRRVPRPTEGTGSARRALPEREGMERGNPRRRSPPPRTRRRPQPGRGGAGREETVSAPDAAARARPPPRFFRGAAMPHRQVRAASAAATGTGTARGE
ncbi:basic proline-rich protein-like [Calypte anna]|uniref:basic proline-rich protein-like n=1 Tax=Calypte anna TaxID=9244 RepID=UPI0011C39C19|nr:basic proline-rich protein-like [Calypte anna]